MPDILLIAVLILVLALVAGSLVPRFSAAPAAASGSGGLASLTFADLVGAALVVGALVLLLVTDDPRSRTIAATLLVAGLVFRLAATLGEATRTGRIGKLTRASRPRDFRRVQGGIILLILVAVTAATAATAD